MAWKTPIEISPSRCLKSSWRIAQVLEESSLPELVLHLVTKQDTSAFEFSTRTSCRQLIVFLNTDTMYSGHVNLCLVCLCFTNNVIIFSNDTEIVDSSSMLTQPFLPHSFTCIIVFHHFLPTNRPCHCSVEHLIDIDSITI